jgi:hypothetical protein
MYESLIASLSPRRERLVNHRIYASLDSVEALRHFMTSHVFAVWDFMSLLKTLQRRLTCVDVPWSPPAHREAARLINEIVLGEETDEVSPGVFASHFDIYRDAMHEIGAADTAITRLLGELGAGASVEHAIAGVPSGPRAFVRATFAMLERPTVEVAAAFFFGREELVPAMFTRALAALANAGIRAPGLRWYLERHVEVDGGDHGPKAARLLSALCGDDPDRWAAAERAAITALRARAELWDSIAPRPAIALRSETCADRD